MILLSLISCSSSPEEPTPEVSYPQIIIDSKGHEVYDWG